MKPTTTLHDLGQSLWLDNITRELINSGTLQRYIDELSVTGLTSNPTIFDNAIKNSSTYDADIASLRKIMAEWARTDADYATRRGHLEKGGGLTPTKGTIYGAPASPLARGKHTAIAYARTATHAYALAWTFSV